MYAVDEAGKRTKAAWNTSIHKLKDKSWNYQVKSNIVSGATLKQITNQQLPTEGIEEFDVTLVVTMLNSVPGSELNAFSEQTTLGGEALELCRRLKGHR